MTAISPTRAYVVALVLLTGGLAAIVVATGVPWLLLALVLGVVATRGWARVVVGVLVGLVGLAVALGFAWVSATGTQDGPAATLAILGGVLVALVGAWTVRRGRAWPSMGSRYERTGTASKRARRLSDWEALDRGIDPTADPADPRPESTSG